jgi:hypothetical protein
MNKECIFETKRVHVRMHSIVFEVSGLQIAFENLQWTDTSAIPS